MAKRGNCFAITFSLAAIVGLTVRAGSYSWTGGGDGSRWDLPANWGVSEGVPGAGDDVTIAAASDTHVVLPAEGVTVAQVTSISGSVTFSGGAFSVVDNAQYRFNVGASSEVTFHCAFSYADKLIRPYLPSGSTINFKGGIVGSSYFCTYGLGTVNVSDTACDIGVVSSGSNTFNFYVPVTNAEGSVRAEFMGDSIVHFRTNVFETTGYFGLDNSYAIVHCHGFDQSFGNMYGLRGTLDTDEGKPVTVTFKQTADITNTGFNWSGPLSLRMGSGSTADYVLDRSVDSSGSLTVEGGTFAFAENGAWPNLSALSVNGGKVRLAAGKVLTVPALYLDGSTESAPNGTYGAGADAEHVDTVHFDGEGLVLVKRFEPASVSGTWTGGAGTSDSSVRSAANWQETGIPDILSGGSLVATFAQAGTVATIDGATAFKGIVFDAPEDFSLVSAGFTYGLGSAGYVVRGAHVYTLNAPSSIAYGQTWDVAEGSTLDVVAGVASSDANADILRIGKGVLNLRGENTFEGSFAIENGQVNVYSSKNAFGRACGTSCVTLNEKTTCDGGVALCFMPGAVTTNEKPFLVYGSYVQSTPSKNLYFSTGSRTVFNGKFNVSSYLKTSVCTCSEVVFGGGFGIAQDSPSGFVGFIGEGGGTRPIIRFEKTPASGGELSLTHADAWFDVTGSDFDRIETHGWGYLDTTADFAWDGTGNFNFEGYGCVDLHGHDQRVGRISLVASSLGNQPYSGRLKSSEGPATLFFNQRDDVYGSVATNSTTIIEGCLSLSKSGARDFVQNCAAMSSGDVEVTEGRFVFTENGSWVNGSNVVVRGTGRLVLSSAQTFHRKVTVTIADSGVLELNDASDPMSCKELFLPDGKGGVRAAVAGMWGGVGSGAANESASIAGLGRLFVRGSGSVVIIR